MDIAGRPDPLPGVGVQNRCLRQSLRPAREPAWRRPKPRRLATSAMLLLAALLLIPGQTHALAKSKVNKGGTVGFLLPESKSARWVQDASYFVQALGRDDHRANAVILNAGGDAKTQLDQANTAIANGAKVLIVAPVNGSAAAPIIGSAHSHHVKVIAYDSLIEAAGVDLYTGFNARVTGKLQARFVVKHSHRGDSVALLNGPSGDVVAEAVYHGSYVDVIKAKLKQGSLRLAGSDWTPGWSQSGASRELTALLKRSRGRVNEVVAADDSIASGAVAALKADHLGKKVLVTGADATLSGLRHMLRGYQAMTVYRPVYREADAAASAAAAFLLGEPVPKQFDHRVTIKGSQVKAALFKPVLVTPSNIAKTVIKDKYVTRQALCKGLTKQCNKYKI